MSKYTPGPWELLEVGDKCKHLCPSKDNMSILTVALEYDANGEPDYFGAVYRPEDARLIAAAPDMREKIEAALKEWDILPQDRTFSLAEITDWLTRYMAPAMDAMRAIIAKAEGRS